MIRVLLADDHQIVIDGLQLMLHEQHDMTCTAVASDGHQALQTCLDQEIDVAILDISMPGINGIEVTRSLAEARPFVRIIGLSMISEVSLIRSMLQYGALGFLPKNACQQELIGAIREVHSGRRYIPVAIQNLLDGPRTRLRTTLCPMLSRREKEVMRLIINEHTTPEISEALFISEVTVESHRRNMLSKLGVRNTAGLVRTCIENALLD